MSLKVNEDNLHRSGNETEENEESDNETEENEESDNETEEAEDQL